MSPRDHDGSFDPQLIQKNQRRSGVLDRKIIVLYSKGMSTREITETIKDIYQIDVSPTLVSFVTASVIDDVRQWQNRQLDPIYPIVFIMGA